MIPDNYDRAEWAAKTLDAFMSIVRTDPEDALGDLLCDLRHWCDREGVDFDAVVASSGRMYRTEVAEDGGKCVRTGSE